MANVTVRENPGVGEHDNLNDAFNDSALLDGDTIFIEGTWTADDTSQVSTTKSDISVIANGPARCTGVYAASPTHYRHRYAGASGHSLTFDMDQGNRSISFDGVEVIRVGGVSSDECIRFGYVNSANKLFFKNGLAGFTAPISNGDIFYAQSTNNTQWDIENTAFINAGRAACGFWGGSATGLNANINSCHSYNLASVDTGAGAGLVGFRSIGAGNTCAIFNSAVHCAGGQMPVSTEQVGDLLVTVNDSFTQATAWHHLQTDTTETNSPKNVVWKTAAGGDTTEVLVLDLTGQYDLRLLDDAANNDAQEFHSNGSGAGLTMPATDLFGTTRTAPHSLGFHVPGAVGPVPPSGVDAGGPYSGTVSTPIQLDGSFTPGSDPTPTLTWSIDSGGTGTFLPNENVEDPTFTPDQVGPYVLRFSVDPDDGPPVEDTANLTSTAGFLITSFNGVPIEDIAEINGVPIGNITSINGVTIQ